LHHFLLFQHPFTRFLHRFTRSCSSGAILAAFFLSVRRLEELLLGDVQRKSPATPFDDNGAFGDTVAI
ncbi:MAG: hypothetical protein ACOC41_06485, partial [Chitinivibrionales bacterium]